MANWYVMVVQVEMVKGAPARRVGGQTDSGSALPGMRNLGSNIVEVKP